MVLPPPADGTSLAKEFPPRERRKSWLGSVYGGFHLLAAAVRVSVFCWVLLLSYCFVVAVTLLRLVVLGCWQGFSLFFSFAVSY
jgi:hypothetical protein